MNKKHIFNFNADKLPLFSKEKISFMKRDMEEFRNYGYSMERAAELKAEIDVFNELPTDQELLGDVMIATEKKVDMVKGILAAIRSVMLRVQRKYGISSPWYKKFGVSSLSLVKDYHLLSATRRVARVAAMYLNDLKEKGLTSTHIEALSMLADEFEECLQVQDDARADREIGTETRVGAANQIYSKISELCETGKGIWKYTNEAKYNDYVIYKVSSKAANLTGPI